jgi:hypothetical protein
MCPSTYSLFVLFHTRIEILISGNITDIVHYYRNRVLSEIDKSLTSGVDADNDTFMLIASSIYLLEKVCHMMTSYDNHENGII